MNRSKTHIVQRTLLLATVGLAWTLPKPLQAQSLRTGLRPPAALLQTAQAAAPSSPTRLELQPRNTAGTSSRPLVQRKPGAPLPAKAKAADTMTTNLVCEVATVSMKPGTGPSNIAFFDGTALNVTVKNVGKGFAPKGVKVEIRRADSPGGPRVAWFGAGATTAILAPGAAMVVKLPFIPVADLSTNNSLAAKQKPQVALGNGRLGKPPSQVLVVAVVDADNVVAEGPAGESDNASKPFLTGVIQVAPPPKLPPDPSGKPNFDGTFTITDVKYTYDKASKKITEVKVQVKADCDNDFFLGDYGMSAYGSVYARCLVFTVENPGMRDPYKIVGDNIFSVAKTIWGGPPGYLKPMTYPQSWIPPKASFWIILKPDCKQAVQGASVTNQKTGMQVSISPKVWVKLAISTSKSLRIMEKEVTISEAL